MELPQPRPFETEGRKPSHDFLSLCSHSTNQPDPRTASQGGYLKTHNFLQPLERVGRGGAKEETSSIDTSGSEILQPPAPPPSSVDQQHVLPGGLGTYTISHIPYFHQRIPKPEVPSMFTVSQASGGERNTDENSNCSLYAASGFTLWDETEGKKGQKKKENVGERTSMRADAATTMGQWLGPEQQSQSSAPNNHRNSFSSLSSSQVSGLKSQSFMDMILSAKASSQEADGDGDEELVMKKVDLRVKVDGKSTGSDEKPSTPRSKHSATEQRRRSKINDRFQMLRQLIPYSDQKRDKASFLLEEKVNKHEGSYYHGWNPEETGKLMNGRNRQQVRPEGGVAKLEKRNNSDMAERRGISNGEGMDRQCDVARGSRQKCEREGRGKERESSCNGVPSEGKGMIESGSISIASGYSQGMMKKLTQALESSGVDLTKASISVQIDLPKQSSLSEVEIRRTRPRTETEDDHPHPHPHDFKKLKTHTI